MKNTWRKLRDCWLDFSADDELDMDKKHLSQHDKRSLLYGGFMIGAATFGLFSIGKTRHISIEIHFNLKPIPEVEQVTA